MKTIVIIFAAALFAAPGVFAQHAGHHASHGEEQKAKPVFKDEKIAAVYDEYIALKNALVASDAGEAANTAGKLSKSLSSFPAASKAAAGVAKAVGIESQRKAFSELSNEMKNIIRESGLSQGAVYIAFCPMANDNEGAFWLSSEKEIRNPYFGDMMLQCGSVKETIQ